MDYFGTFRCKECANKRRMKTRGFGTEHYSLYKTDDGWLADPHGGTYEWFDFPRIRFDCEGVARFSLKGESFDCRSDYGVFMEFARSVERELEAIAGFIQKSLEG
ncbi:hypothetical protein [Bifidobacterium oedipodis]|uniref:Uncharacterized protein n=1 Tax=Bifidobacterium oedipodis TaxID=2675322 RepID=A0A7Y0EP97_9BIFI|nr:hypothetical protein [Bifidobacterium sp. DSM 109957]NMM93894.1 hypothetical protein [Bifidobacterium sp. DSM 109957]